MTEMLKMLRVIPAWTLNCVERKDLPVASEMPEWENAEAVDGPDTPENRKAFGRKVRMRRKELGWDQKALARAAHTSRDTIGRIERGISEVKRATLDDVSEALFLGTLGRSVRRLTDGNPPRLTVRDFLEMYEVSEDRLRSAVPELDSLTISEEEKSAFPPRLNAVDLPRPADALGSATSPGGRSDVRPTARILGGGGKESIEALLTTSGWLHDLADEYRRRADEFEQRAEDLAAIAADALPGSRTEETGTPEGDSAHHRPGAAGGRRKS